MNIDLEKSNIFSIERNIKIKPLNPNESQKIELSFSNINLFIASLYNVYFNFKINKKIIGVIEIKIKIIDDSNPELVDKFIDKFNWPKYDKEQDKIIKKIIKTLKSCNCDLNNNFDKLIE